MKTFSNLLSGCRLLLQAAWLVGASMWLTGCEKTTLTSDEMDLVKTSVRSHVIAEAFDDIYVDIWNEDLNDQLMAAYERYLEEITKFQRDPMFGGFAELIDMLAVSSGKSNQQKADWAAKVIKQYEERYKTVQNEMITDIKNGAQKADQRIDAMYDFFHDLDEEVPDSLREKGETLRMKQTLPYREWMLIEKNEKYLQGVRDIDHMIQVDQKFDITGVALTDFEQNRKLTQHFEYFLFRIVFNTFNRVKDVQIDYIVKEPETENSFEVGFSNHTAKLCTFSESNNMVRVDYESIEYDQRFIGMGME